MPWKFILCTINYSKPKEKFTYRKNERKDERKGEEYRRISAIKEYKEL